MNRRDLENSINRSWTFLEEIDLASSYSQAGALPISEEFRDLALSPDTKYTSLYMNGLRNSHYNILLKDFSYFQYGIDREEEVRYAYYANPFISGLRAIEKFTRINELFEGGFIEIEEYDCMLNDMKPEIRIPLIRYENAPKQHIALKHPCSHLHIGFHSENRWPVRRLITATAFTMIIVKQYYPREWEVLNSALHGSLEESLDERLIVERQNCRVVSDEYFTELEGRSFYFG